MSEEAAAATIMTEAPAEAPQENTAVGSWRESLPEAIREAGALRDIPDVATLAKAYTDAQSYIGRSIRIPGEDAGEDVWNDFNAKLMNVPGMGRFPGDDATPEEWDAFYARAGRPGSAKDYRIGNDGRALDDAEQALLEKLHELGLNNNQANGLVDWMNSGVQENNNIAERSQAEALSQLKQDWGQAFDVKIQDARAALNVYGGEELARELEATGLGNNVALVKAFAEIGRGFSEDPAMAVGDRSQLGVTPAEARHQIDEILSNPAHPYNDANNPGHDAAIEKVSKLYQAVYRSDDKAEPDMFERRLGLG